jgi:hypothetical protein
VENTPPAEGAIKEYCICNALDGPHFKHAKGEVPVRAKMPWEEQPAGTQMDIDG